MLNVKQHYFLFFALALFLFLNYISAALSSSSSGNSAKKKSWLPRIIPKTSNPIIVKETNDRTELRKIYMKHGAGNNRICQSIDNSRTIRGYGLCKKAILRVFNLETKNFIVKCIDQIVTPDDTEIVPAKDLETFTHTVVFCMHGLFTLYIMHAAQDYYYVFDYKKRIPPYPRLTAILKLTPQKTDYPVIELKETDDIYEIDNIFGCYGVGKFTDPKGNGHVCQKPGNSKKILGEEIFEKITRKLKMSIAEQNDVTCIKKQILRVKATDKSDLPKWSKTISMMKGFINYSAPIRSKAKMASTPIAIFNAHESNYYYVAKLNKNSDWSLTNIVKVD